VFSVRSKFNLAAVWRLRAALNGYDVVHTHGPRAMFIGNPDARLAGVRAVFTTFHEFSYTKAYETRWYRLYNLIERFLAGGWTDHLIAITEAIREDALSARGIAPSKITRIYNALSLEHFGRVEDQAATGAFRERLGLRAGELAVGVVGRFTPMKGQRYAIEAFPQVQKAVPNARLVLVGGGPLENELRALAQQLGVNAIFPGSLSEMKLLYNTLDVLAHPALSEPFGLVVLEAIACGLPVVATNRGGLPEVTGFSPHHRIVPAGEAAALAQALIEMLQAMPARTTPADLASRFTLKTFAEQHEALYRRFVGTG
jgi:glycosyltransferase involved in cell wall biosynthesis